MARPWEDKRKEKKEGGKLTQSVLGEDVTRWKGVVVVAGSQT